MSWKEIEPLSMGQKANKSLQVIQSSPYSLELFYSSFPFRSFDPVLEDELNKFVFIQFHNLSSNNKIGIIMYIVHIFFVSSHFYTWFTSFFTDGTFLNIILFFGIILSLQIHVMCFIFKKLKFIFTPFNYCY